MRKSGPVWHARAFILKLASFRVEVDAIDESFGGTPLNWALYAWGNANEREAEHGLECATRN